MILKIISFLILAPLAVMLVVFCVANREAIDVSFDPIGTMPQFAFQAPLFVLLLCSLILGLLLGGFGTWMSQSHHRTKAANRRREIENLRHELELSNERMRRLREERDRELAAAQGPALAGPTQGHGARALAGPSVAA